MVVVVVGGGGGVGVGVGVGETECGSGSGHCTPTLAAEGDIATVQTLMPRTPQIM